MISADEVWARIEANEGGVFRQIRGGEFTYSIKASYLKPSRTNRKIPKSDFAVALLLVPLENTSLIQQTLQGPSFIYAILMDARIRQSDW
jgi:hypothetical protein